MEASIRHTYVMLSGLLFLVLQLQTSQDVRGTEIVGCPIFRFMHNKSCHPCPGNCRECVSDANCTLCQKGYYGSTCDKACRGECRGTCHKLYGHCTYGCPDGEYPAETNGCRSCPHYCTLCESQSKCVLCDDGHSGEACQDTCLDNCSRCDKSTRQCLQCKDSYFSLDGQCKSCPPGCTRCVSDRNCTQCKKAYFLENGQCKSCPYGSRLCSNITDSQECEDGFLGPINGICLLICFTNAVNKYIIPDKDGRCGIWQDTDTNICDKFGQTDKNRCTSSGHCLQDVSCSCPVAGSCNYNQVKNSSCSAVRQYYCTHQCLKVLGLLVCEAICSERSDKRGNTTSVPMTQDSLSKVALTFKNTNEAICHQVKGSKSECKETDNLHTVVTFVVVMVIIIIIIAIIFIINKRRFIVKTIFRIRTHKNIRRYENDNVPDSEDQRHDMEDIPSSVAEIAMKFPDNCFSGDRLSVSITESAQPLITNSILGEQTCDFNTGKSSAIQSDTIATIVINSLDEVSNTKCTTTSDTNHYLKVAHLMKNC